MKFFLLPISTRRTLLYCQKVQVLPTHKQTWVDKATVRAAQLWSGWEKKEAGWQKKVVVYGNSLLRRIPYEEWGLKSVPPLSTRRREEEILGKDKNHLVFPETIIPTTKATSVLRTLATERESLHKSRLLWCLVGMPISAPFALVPVIPNLPFFYLVYRAWSHWRALAGGKHLQFLCDKNILSLMPSSGLNSIYSPLIPDSSVLKDPLAGADKSSSTLNNSTQPEEKMLLSQENGRQLVKILEIPELEVELERAIWQVEGAIRRAKEAKVEKEESAKPSDTTKNE
ncbi:mitochondrial K+-H+ exchange-related-domain-containing protein [Hypoxylon fragiforme]|uniref:mitochondrial K+-H+ exchange-related-domain-containing protein n=1 Tax=Hypoxylon fragiforme TaxID=63214 RepID=UPI0020C65E23|nr:mitochondrial K+-H+ exchange-related-domain-containing protein [Hypoxylon fragiforme]KAI2613844.1 mitochondrial K+-H+ exchange-related-domain-containing protein [Hypoxylon fragiforme]